MDRLRNVLILNILEFLNIYEVVRLEMLSKRFYGLLRENPKVIFQLLSREFPTERRAMNFVETRELVKRIYSGSSENLNILAYYTNGKIIWNNHTSYTMLNLFTANCCLAYTSEYRYIENILVKGVYTEDLDPLELIDLNILSDNYIENDELYLRDTLVKVKGSVTSEVVVTHAEVTPINSGYTCPLFRAICFISSRNIETCSFFENFYSCSTAEDLIEVAAGLGLETVVNETDLFTLVLFKKSQGDIQPLF